MLVHGFPSNSYIWRRVAPALSASNHVYVYDLPGQGASERRDGMDVSDPFQAKVLSSLLRYWDLQRPAIVLHDAGCCYGMTAYHYENIRYERIALISAGLMYPCISAATKHAMKHLDAYRTMPVELHELIIRARLGSTTFKPMSEGAIAAYLKPWLGAEGQALWFNRVAQLSDEHFSLIESKLGPMDVPVSILWGKEDRWIPVDQAERLKQYITNADLHIIDDAGHFLMEDAPEEVSGYLANFLAPSQRSDVLQRA